MEGERSQHGDEHGIVMVTSKLGDFTLFRGRVNQPTTCRSYVGSYKANLQTIVTLPKTNSPPMQISYGSKTILLPFVPCSAYFRGENLRRGFKHVLSSSLMWIDLAEDSRFDCVFFQTKQLYISFREGTPTIPTIFEPPPPSCA